MYLNTLVIKFKLFLQVKYYKFILTSAHSKQFTARMDCVQNIVKATVPFLIGGVSGALATLVIQPLDTLKVQVQIISERLGRVKSSSLSIFNIMAKIQSEQGLQILYRGLDSAILRQLFYASARLGAYDVLVQKFERNDKKLKKIQKVGVSFISGAFGALVGNPFDVALIRRQASISNGKNAYVNTLDAFKSMIKSQGILSLWSGINITIMRVGLVNFGQLAGRDFISQALQPLHLKDNHNNVVALSASFLTSAISLPADNIKVKLQKQDKIDKMYKGIWDCLAKSVQRQGILRLWVGFPIYLIRGAPHSFILIRTQMFLNQKWKQYKRGE